MSEGTIRLYVVPASHPCAAVEFALKLKGLAYERVDLLPIVHVVHQRFAFGRRTVPGVVLPDGARVVGSRAIVRVLDGLEPKPPLFPRAAAARAKVEAVEAWGDEVLQPLARRVTWAALQARQDALESYAEGADLPVPVSVALASAPVVVRLERALNRSSEAAVRGDLRELPSLLDRADAHVAEGVLGGDQVNAADLQVASSLRLLATLEDLRPRIAGRPSGELALRLFPDFPGSTPAGALAPLQPA